MYNVIGMLDHFFELLTQHTLIIDKSTDGAVLIDVKRKCHNTWHKIEDISYPCPTCGEQPCAE